jgi:hypothetical protein
MKKMSVKLDGFQKNVEQKFESVLSHNQALEERVIYLESKYRKVTSTD